ncbi:MAG: hypothetical protein K5792_04445 [Butyrivibrio sp.]|nr:hypothetical protein [Butyrivibrio sp.]
MRGKRLPGIIIALSTVLALTGCGEKFPDLTEEQYNQTVEYAVGLLMKYSNNGQAKLTYVDAKEEQDQRDREARKKEREEKKKAEEEKNQQQTYTPPVASDTEEPDTFDSTDDMDDGEEVVAIGSSEDEGAGPDNEEAATSGSSSESAGYDPSAITLSSEDSQEIMPDIFLSYQGYSVSSTYPESSKSYVVNADKGKKLLVLRFDLYNASSSTKEVNIINLKLLFQIKLNGKNLGYSSVTFLPNDLASYIGSIESKAHESLVVLTQINEKDTSNIQNLSLIVTQDGQEQKINLK